MIFSILPKTLHYNSLKDIYLKTLKHRSFVMTKTPKDIKKELLTTY